MDSVTFVQALVIAFCLLGVTSGLWLRLYRIRQIRDKHASNEVALIAMATAGAQKTHFATHSEAPLEQPGKLDLTDFTCQYDPVVSELHVYSKLAQFGPVTEFISVHKGGVLLLFGTATASITLRPGSTAYIYSQVLGDIIDEGGELKVFGTVFGKISLVAKPNQEAGTQALRPIRS